MPTKVKKSRQLRVVVWNSHIINRGWYIYIYIYIINISFWLKSLIWGTLNIFIALRTNWTWKSHYIIPDWPCLQFRVPSSVQKLLSCALLYNSSPIIHIIIYFVTRHIISFIQILTMWCGVLVVITPAFFI